MVLVGEEVDVAAQAKGPRRVLGLLEAGREQLRLQTVGVGDEQVEIDEVAQRRRGVAAGDLRPFQQHDRLLRRSPDAGEELGRDRVTDRGELLLGAKVIRNLPARGAPAAAGEELEPVGAERGEGGSRVDQLVDAAPER